MRRVVLWNSAPGTERYAQKSSTADCRSRISVHLAGHGRFVFYVSILISCLYKKKVSLVFALESSCPFVCLSQNTSIID